MQHFNSTDFAVITIIATALQESGSSTVKESMGYFSSKEPIYYVMLL
jgi:hypothetical protein